MQVFNEIMVCYDIENDKLRKKIQDLLKDIGLERVQYSVFWGFVNIAEESNLKRKLYALLENNASDKCLVLRSNLSDKKEYTAIGYGEDDFKKRENYDVF